MSEKRLTEVLKFEGAKLIFKNFRGKETEFNPAGSRNFGVLLDEDVAERLCVDGWNVKRIKNSPDYPEGEGPAWLPVKIKFQPYPPIAVLINSRGKKRLDEDTIEQIDWSMIKNCDLIIRPYNYPAIGGRPAGVTAYLKAIYVTISEDEFEQKYSHIPDLDGTGEEEEIDEY